MNSLKFSFLMPAYKKKYIQEAICSIIHQTYQAFELVIIDDASPDDIKGIVSLFNDSRIIYQRNEKNIGGSNLIANWNHCLEFAQYEYIILATDDDVFESNFLQDAVLLLKKYPNANILRTGVKIIDEAGHIRDYEYPLKEFMSCKEYTLLWSKGGLHSCISNYIFRKEELVSNGGFLDFPHGHYSDDATALAMSRDGIVCISNANFNFRISSASLSYTSDYRLTLSQIEATKSFISWYIRHLNNIYEEQRDNYMRNNSFEFFRNRYKKMLTILVSKIPCSKIVKVIQITYNIKFIYKKEKIQLFVSYLFNSI